MATSVLNRKDRRKEEFLSFFSDFGERFAEDNLFSRAASLAYYATLAIAPFTLITLVALSLLGPAIVGAYTREVTRFLGPQAGSVFATVVANAKESPDVGTFAGVISAVTLMVSASAVFGELRDALNHIHRIDRPTDKNATWFEMISGFVRLRLWSAGLVLGFIFVLMSSLILSSLATFLSGGLPSRLTWLVNYLGSGLAYVLTFSLLTRYVPSQRVPWGDALRGGLIMAVFFFIGKEVLSRYLGSNHIATVYGAAGSLVIFLLWVYYSAAILLACAEINELVRARAMKGEPRVEAKGIL